MRRGNFAHGEPLMPGTPVHSRASSSGSSSFKDVEDPVIPGELRVEVLTRYVKVAVGLEVFVNFVEFNVELNRGR